jgi:cyanate permease
MGIFFTIYYAIMLVTPPVAGAISDATGNFQGPIWLAIILFALVVPLSITFQYFKHPLNLGLKKKV